MNLKDVYQKEVKTKLAQELGIKNPLAVPGLVKIVLNIGLKEAAKDKKLLETVAEQLTTISGQKPKVNKAKVAIAGFKLSVGDTIGLSVTLRGKRMFDFFGKLIHIVLPRVRDFRGLDRDSFDGRGNYNLGINEQIIFPEIDYSKIDKIRGLEITIVTTAKNNEQGRRLLELLGMPFKKS
ncbi:50S ribosomal protein L5 [Candidatus Microgenomates bacterium]|nr:50S ribosomal protein L5 [Candidatus Microgenomates bacterium]